MPLISEYIANIANRLNIEYSAGRQTIFSLGSRYGKPRLTYYDLAREVDLRILDKPPRSSQVAGGVGIGRIAEVLIVLGPVIDGSASAIGNG